METKEKRAPFSYDEANFFNDIFMTWMFPLANFYRKTRPDVSNMIDLPKRFNYEHYYKKVKLAWKEESKAKDPNLFKALWKVFKKEFFIAILPGSISYNSLVLSAMLIFFIVNYCKY